MDVRETLISFHSHAPQTGTKSTTQACFLTMNQTSPVTFQFAGPNQLSHTDQGMSVLSEQDQRKGTLTNLGLVVVGGGLSECK